MNLRERDVLDYHEQPRPGKLDVQPSKPCVTQVDLAMAHVPGVAVPCQRIRDNPADVYRYTGKGNLVAVVSNGTSVLGLGAIGPLAGKPVTEGMAVLFKRFAQIDVFDLELATQDPDEFVRALQVVAPTFGGIHIQDVEAPACFEIERKLAAAVEIPVFHDDQGTAIIAGAALLNGCDLAAKDLGDLRIVVAGAGSAGLACVGFFVELGADPRKILLVDSHGVVRQGRTEGMNDWKSRYAQATDRRTLAEAMVGADVLLGASVPGVVTEDMILSMADNPIVFTLAWPEPEISFERAVASRDDIILATARSDHPNQVNHVLAFPFIFRGALDVHARAINLPMKLAAARALARLAKEPVPDIVQKSYGGERLGFGRRYLLPKPFDHRVLHWVAPAVARAAMESGAAKDPIDIEEYTIRLERLLGWSRAIMRVVMNRARRSLKNIVFPEAEEDKVLSAVETLVANEVARPVLLGDEERIRSKVRAMGLDLGDVRIVDPRTDSRRTEFAHDLYRLRRRKGMTPYRARELLKDPLIFGLMMVREGEEDGLVCGINRSYPEMLSPTLQLIPLKPGVRRVAGMYVMVLKDRVLFFADATVTIEPTAEDLAEIALMSARTAQKYFDIEPRVAMLSFSNFGSVRHAAAEKVERATKIAQQADPTLIVDGEMQVDTALVPELAQSAFPHSSIQGDANVLIFPDLQSGNVAYKIVQHLTGSDVVGPILMGLQKPVNVLNHYSSTGEIVNIAAITAVMAGQDPATTLPKARNQSAVEV